MFKTASLLSIRTVLIHVLNMKVKDVRGHAEQSVTMIDLIIGTFFAFNAMGRRSDLK